MEKNMLGGTIFGDYATFSSTSLHGFLRSDGIMCFFPSQYSSADGLLRLHSVTLGSTLCEDMPLSLLVRVGVALTRTRGILGLFLQPAVSRRLHFTSLCVLILITVEVSATPLYGDIGRFVCGRVRWVLDLRVPRQNEAVAVCFSV